MSSEMPSAMYCHCGKPFAPTWHNWDGYVWECECGNRIKVKDARGPGPFCGVRVAGLTCGKPVIGRGYPAAQMVCQDCAWQILYDSLRHGATRDYARDFFAQWEISDARQRIALEEFQQKQAEAEARKAAAEASATHIVYYVHFGENHIKIGTTGRLEQRMKELRVANRVNLLAAEPGDRAVEKKRHRQFTILRYDSRKEDFAESPRLLKHIDDVRNQWGDPWDLPARLLAGSEGGDVLSA